ncbi:glycosyltransferase [Campylobacter mucosalis]|uniref:GumK N-terminal domain-containing glycosyltransferase n=1 Tax=Campylobacter mucosalis TaxID=202 RepID=UPI0014702018|nr:glycosyltransferase [Campylobacter mucosalis]
MSKKVLMAVANYYTSPFQVGSHHYARAFEKLGYEVLFISAPISPIHKIFANSQDLQERERIYKNGGERVGNIFYYVPKAFLIPQNKPLLSSKFIFNNWQNFTYPNLLSFIEKNGFKDVDILWFDSPLFGFLLDKISYKKSILRLADYSKGFSTVSNTHYEAEINIANRVDKVIYSAKNLKDKYIEIRDKSKMHYVPNGIDLEFFKNADKTMPKELENIPQPRVIYVGAIHDWFDVDLVYYCATNLPNYHFVIIGPEQKDLSKLKVLENIHILGAMPYHKIPAFLYNCQVGIIPFDVKNHADLVNSINPLKIYEYFAAKISAVAVDWQELKHIDDLVFLSSSKEDFVTNIKKSINLDNDRMNKIAKFIKDNDWKAKTQRVLDLSFSI